MAMQMYFVSATRPLENALSHELQQLVHDRGGFILMVTRTGMVIVLDDTEVPAVQKNPNVRAVGGVTLSPNGAASDRLQRIFAENLSRQVDLSRLVR